jgi:Protein of unknown function (DUF1838)
MISKNIRTIKSIQTFVALTTFAAGVSLVVTPSTAQQIGIDEFIRVRCTTTGENVYTQWQGSMYAFVPQERQRKLFNILGMNVARCIKNKQGEWQLLSRELNYYLDPKTNKIVHKWENSWTGETVAIAHVANNPVQNVVSGSPKSEISSTNVTFVVDVPLTYPNVLASDAKFKDYSPEKLYQAGEFFKLTTSLKELRNSTHGVKNMHIDWMRVSPWLPWMKMKGKPGYLVYSATGSKLANFEELSPLLKEEINSRLPLYKEAPRCFLAAENESSWSYFGKYFAEYLKAERFPIAAPVTQDVCES